MERLHNFPLLLLTITLTTLTLCGCNARHVNKTLAQCVPDDNCKAPECRCWDDTKSPGGFAPEDTPQIVLVSFAYALNQANEKLYTSIFDGVTNPNGCPTKGTFFVQSRDSNFDVIKSVYDQKHEIGVTTSDGTTPTSPTEWVQAFEDVKIQLEQKGIPANEVIGSRAPELFVGGDYQFDSIVQNQLEYDSSCVSQVFTGVDSLIWPYTYDFVDTTPKCSIGADPSSSYKGKWQFLVADLSVNGQKCATPSACTPFINTTQEAFDLIFNAFADHYEGKRAPFVLYIDPLWLTNSDQNQGTKQFLEFIRTAFDDTWIITNQQALAWIKDPTASSDINDFDPWKCSTSTSVTTSNGSQKP